MLSLPKDLDAMDYSVQRVYVNGMMKLIARLLQAESEVDDEIKREVSALPDGFVFRMEAIPGTPCMMVQCRDGALHVLPDSSPIKPNLTIRFKHVTHAFLVLAFQEGTATAYANDRILIDGDPGLAMKVVRCLNRVQAIALPKVIAEKAVKTYPDLKFGDKLQVSLKTYGKLVLNLAKEI
ncbi:MAG: SCP2 sterol-binding domain-containing protein [Pseudomonadales bacterium]|nr:SCP2 sterol-binding domain-containing protein [Pseudomonadales bacterium]